MFKRVLAASVLVLAMSTGAFAQAPVPPEGATYISNDTCKICHDKATTGDQWHIWKNSKHAEAYQLLLSDKAKEAGTKAGLKETPADSPQCLRCHVTAYNFKTKSVPPEVQMKDGVACQECHGPGSLHQKDGSTLMFHPGDASELDLSAHIIRPDEKTCLVCHNSENPTYNPERYTLADGTKADFDYKQAYEKIAHPVPGKTPWIK
jgi:hypothetical protein